MIPQRIHLAILCATIVVLIAFLVSLLAPTQAGAASRPRPCVGRIDPGYSNLGLVRIIRADGSVCVRAAGALPSKTKVKR
jgi:hypothetical protein